MLLEAQGQSLLIGIQILRVEVKQGFLKSRLAEVESKGKARHLDFG